MEIKAYLAEGLTVPEKPMTASIFATQMPNDTACRLAKHAMVDVKDAMLAAEWKKAKDDLWDSVSSLVNKFNGTDDPNRDRFYDILPIHPMAAILLKHCRNKQSQTSAAFSSISKAADGTEFQDFIRTGGPEVANKQFFDRWTTYGTIS
jgi:hypothetical protein